MDFSDEALFAMYDFESSGTGAVKSDNGFAHGKKWMDVAVAQWREDLWVTLNPLELYEDAVFPHWWLDKVLRYRFSQAFNEYGVICPTEIILSEWRKG